MMLSISLVVRILSMSISEMRQLVMDLGTTVGSIHGLETGARVR